ncbi:hypothetical protein BJ170DRAFT_381106 [Xylariales sp. AK1849]|nr:hypothetical protein BJ170DRAFT_381106 [Xylariales sp. AK1849]
MDDEILNTCLSSEPHDDNIKEHLLHFLGCIDISDRYKFLNEDDHPLWQGETQHYIKLGNTPEEAAGLSREKRQRWMADCQSELRRIDFLRDKVSEDKEDSHLVDKVKESGRGWKQSKEYRENIEDVKAWRTAKGKLNEDSRKCYEPAKHTSRTAYESEKDVNVPFMEFENSKPAEEKLTHDIWGKFPDQKTTIKSLLDEQKGPENLLYRHRFPERIKYFHLPSNNMLWAEEAIARFFNQEKPNFHAIRRELQRQANSEAALVLKESHWRGQLHGGRNTTNSRFMRPFCEAVSSHSDDVDPVPRNLVLFMPYLHWETTRSRERFAQLIEEIVYKKKKERRRADKKNKEARQQERLLLKRPVLEPTADENRTSSIFGEITDRVKKAISRDDEVIEELDPQDQADAGSDEDAICDTAWQPRFRRRIFTMGTLLDKMKLPKSEIEIDERGRVKIRNKLGQYLIDAARLFEGMTNYRDKKLLENFLIADAPMHPRRTLDQAYYWSLNNTRSRDRDQVVYRATTPDPGAFHSYNAETCRWKDHDHLAVHETCDDCTANIRKVSRVVMVDQLWMWILDAKTIITCFPKRYGANKHDSSGVHKSIRIRLGEGRFQQVKSVFDLALIIFEECSNTFFDRTRTSDKQPQVLDAFSEAIGNIMHRQTVGFERLWRWTEEARKIYRSRSERVVSDLHVPLLDINPEGELEKEIKDIVEELGIMVYVNKEHRDVLKQFIIHVDHILDPNGQFGVASAPGPTFPRALDAHRTPMMTPLVTPLIELPDPLQMPEDIQAAATAAKERRDTYKWFKVNADELLTRVNDRIEQLEELERSAEATATSVKDLLDLKSQQAGVVQAWQSVQQSNEAIKQGRSIMVFTVVTIIFLPLSFMSSVFGMNAIDFSDENGNTMHLHEQLTYMFAISAGVIALTLFLSLSAWTRAAIWYVYKRTATSVFVHTGLYQQFLDVDMPSHKLYRHAVEATDKLKDKEIKARLDQRRRKRVAEERKKKTTNQSGPNGSSNALAQNGNGTNGSIPPQATSKRGGWWNCVDADREEDVELGGRR